MRTDTIGDARATTQHDGIRQVLHLGSGQQVANERRCRSWRHKRTLRRRLPTSSPKACKDELAEGPLWNILQLSAA